MKGISTLFDKAFFGLLPKCFICLFCFSIPSLSFGQFSDNFSDGDFSNTPTWLGDTNFFTVTNGELQLNGEDSGATSLLYTNVLVADSTNWEFYVRLELDPSTSNFSKVYLQSDNPDLNAPLNGYFVKVGGISGTDDALELYRQTGTEESLLISGQLGAVSDDPAEARVQVKRDNAGNWELIADYFDGNNFVSQGVAVDNTHNSGSYMGVVCKYTSTKKDKSFFDDFLIDPLFVDTAVPQLLSANPISSMEVDLVFDEPLDEGSILASNFNIDGGLSIVSADLNMDNPTLVHLVLNNNLQNNQSYLVTAFNISDSNGNALVNETASFTYYELEDAEPYDLLINEFYPDKSPQIGLPDAEFIELYNRSNKVIDLQNYSIADAGLNFVNLPSFILQPNAYVILCAADVVPLYQIYGAAIAVALPALNDGGDDIILQNNTGTIIHSISYIPDWISDFEKQGGGWSYELINPGSPCLANENWDASNNLSGGTPGMENSIYDFEVDNIAPSLLNALPISDSQVQAIFSESLSDMSISFSIDNGISIASSSVQGNTILLNLNEALQLGTVYTIEVTNASDCLGNNSPSQSSIFILPEMAEALDIVINEILFNPFSGGFDFIELYNRSDKMINLKGLEISNSQNMQSTEITADYIVAPDSFIVLTESRASILENYTVENPQALVIQDLPGFSDDAGNVTLINLSTVTIIDSYDYDDNQHASFIDEEDGVSLERLDPESETNAIGNWHSAASSVGFATPTYQNSQFFQSNGDGSSIFSLPFSTFSPDGDGYNDILIINFETQGVDLLSNIKIFDSKGRFVHDLLQNTSLANSGNILWDGSTDGGTKARMGIYVLWFELFDTEGNVEYFKETCVLANQL